jgi:hypothetical protein
VDAAEEHPVEHESATGVVVLVFHPASARDLDDDLDGPRSASTIGRQYARAGRYTRHSTLLKVQVIAH